MVGCRFAEAETMPVSSCDETPKSRGATLRGGLPNDADFGPRSLAPRLMGVSPRERRMENRFCLSYAQPTPVDR